MAIKKSELYSSLWSGCDQLRGGMDASQYKDYVLVILFIKYISDKYAGVPYAPITVPDGASFRDMAALKGKPTIGDDINKKIIAPIAEANKLTGIIDVADFNNPDKLGSGKEMVDRLTNLIGIFETPALDFSKNRAEGDDILGDAYEYLMKNFATESGKSKGQFYTPAEVSRVIAKVIGITNKNATATTTVYDPTCGSGSLLLKVADEAEKDISIFGQENDTATRALARMNMILHNTPTAVIEQGNTIANPKFLEVNGRLKTFDYVVANPPFSYKPWSSGLPVQNGSISDTYGRLNGYGIPPAKNGDYAFLLHIIHSMKSKGKGACILPHGVLFRGNTEAEIRKNIIRRGYIKGIIGLPANLFYGTPIPACIVVLDKENAENRKGIFIIDASKGFIKDGNKNRLREQDIHKIVDVFNRQMEIAKYSRLVPVTDIEKNEFNLNIPRYIDSQEAEDIQDIDAHLIGDIPNRDIDELNAYWSVYPTLKTTLFSKGSRSGYSKLKIDKDKIKQTIFIHPEFIVFSQEMDGIFNEWKTKTAKYLKNLQEGLRPKQIIHKIAEDILQSYSGKNLLNRYDIYQHLLNYWTGTMQDDMYELAADGWKSGNEIIRVTKDGKKGKREVEGIAGLEGRLIPPSLIIQTYFEKGQAAINELETKTETVIVKMDELREEHGSDEGLLSEVIDDKQKISKKTLTNRIKELGKKNKDNQEEWDLLQQYKNLIDEES